MPVITRPGFTTLEDLKVVLSQRVFIRYTNDLLSRSISIAGKIQREK